MKQFVYTLLLLLIPLLATANVPTWQIIPGESHLNFTATQNNAPVNGSFKTFSGEIVGDPGKLDTFKIKITVDIGSLSDPYNQITDTLKGKEWFNTDMFPKATFVSSKVIRTGEKSYQVIGTLTIKDKSLPVTLIVQQEELTAHKGRIKGSTTIKRTDFGVGQGEWSDTKSIKDEVLVSFEISASI